MGLDDLYLMDGCIDIRSIPSLLNYKGLKIINPNDVSLFITNKLTSLTVIKLQ